MSDLVEQVARAIRDKLDAEFEERGGLTAEEMADMAARSAIAAMPRLDGETVERVALEMRERCARVAETGSGWISEYHRHGGVPSVMIATAIRALPASTPSKEESA